MANSMPGRWLVPAQDTWFGRLLERRGRHPDEFDCAVRVTEGQVPGEGRRWHYRRSAVDALVTENLRTGATTITLNRSATAHLALAVSGPPRPGSPPLRPGHVVWTAVTADGVARLELAADPEDAHRLHQPDPREV